MADSTSLFFCDGGVVYSVPKTGGAVIVVPLPSGMIFTAVDDTAFYFDQWTPSVTGVFGNGYGELYSQARPLGPLVDMGVSVSGFTAPTFAIADDERIYFASLDTGAFYDSAASGRSTKSLI